MKLKNGFLYNCVKHIRPDLVNTQSTTLENIYKDIKHRDKELSHKFWLVEYAVYGDQ